MHVRAYLLVATFVDLFMAGFAYAVLLGGSHTQALGQAVFRVPVTGEDRTSQLILLLAGLHAILAASLSAAPPTRGVAAALSLGYAASAGVMMATGASLFMHEWVDTFLLLTHSCHALVFAFLAVRTADGSGKSRACSCSCWPPTGAMLLVHAALAAAAAMTMLGSVSGVLHDEASFEDALTAPLAGDPIAVQLVASLGRVELVTALAVACVGMSACCQRTSESLDTATRLARHLFASVAVVTCVKWWVGEEHVLRPERIDANRIIAAVLLTGHAAVGWLFTPSSKSKNS